MKKELNIDSWARKNHFNFFRNFEEPFFGVTVKLECTKAYTYCKQNGYSFFLYYLHKSLAAAINVEAFRYRINGDKVIVYDSLVASSTINRPDGTFGFSYLRYSEDYSEFLKNATIEIEQVRNSNDLVTTTGYDNVIHYSSIPWINFTSLSHARSFSHQDSCPKITFGKMTESNGVLSMPVSIHVYHALMDGYEVGQFVDLFQELMNEN